MRWFPEVEKYFVEQYLVSYNWPGRIGIYLQQEKIVKSIPEIIQYYVLNLRH
jgi:hypothetical protein